MSPRRMQQLTKILGWWGDWVRAGRTWPNYPLGYPTTSVEYRMMREGVVGSAAKGHQMRSRVPLRFTLDPEVESVDRALQRMPEGLRAVLCARYVRGMSLRDGARAVGVTINEFRTQHRMALAWLDGKLAD